MASLLFVLAYGLLQSAPLDKGDVCEQRFAEAAAAREQLRREGRTSEDLYLLIADRSKEALRCYDGAPAKRVMPLYTWETNARRLLGQDEEVRALVNAFFDVFEGTSQDSGSVAFMYRQRGLLHWRSGRFPLAVDDYVEALERTPDSLPIARASSHRMTGRAYRRLRDFDSARSHFAQAEQVLGQAPDSALGTRRTLAAVLLDRVDLTLAQLSRLDEQDVPPRLAEAEAQARKAASLYSRLDDRQDLSYAYSNLAAVQEATGQTEEALTSAREALRLGRQASDVRSVVAAMRRIGLIHLRTDRFAEAYRHLLEALELAEDDDIIDYQRLVQDDLGELREEQGDLGEAERWYRRAIETTEYLQASLGTTRWAALAFEEWQEPYRGLVRVLLAQGRPEAAFVALEQTRARRLRDLRWQARELGDSEDTIRTWVDSRRDELGRVREQIRAAPAGTDVQALHDREKQLEAQLAKAVDLDAAPDVLSLDVLRSALAGRDRVLLSYFIEGESAEAAAGSHVFVVTADTLVALPLPGASASRVRDGLRAVSPLLADVNAAPTLNARQFSLAALSSLYDLLYAPAARFVPEGASLVILPDGPLYTLPFGALVEAEHAEHAYRDAPYLLRKHPVSVELSAALLAEPAPHAETAYPLDVAAFGRSGFDTTDVDQGGVPLQDLPGVQAELASLGGMLRRAYVALEEEATEEALDVHVDGTHVLHLASHALVEPAAPLYSAIVLAPTSGEGASDGIVHLYELERHALSTPLVVLSGCNTARGVQHAGEGPESLQYAFRALGARSVLSTLWLADDEAITELMQRFYRGLRRGLPTDVALQQAQLDYLGRVGDARLANPFFWATPVLYGPAAAIPLEAPRRTGLWIGLIALATVAGVWLYRRLKVGTLEG